MAVKNLVPINQQLQPTQKLKSGLEACGLLADETEVLLHRLAAGQSLADVGRDIGLGLLLKKRTTHGRERILAAMRHRYLTVRPPLPQLPELAAALPALPSPVAKCQVLLPYLLLSDRAAREMVTSLVLPARLAGQPTLTKAEGVSALKTLFAREEAKPFSEYLSQRWVRGLYSVLRDVGLLGLGSDRERLQPYLLRPEAFSFHLWGLYNSGLRGNALLTDPFWRLLLIRDDEVRGALRTAAGLGFFRFTSVAASDEVIPVHQSLLEWARHASTHHLG